ncbi:MAG TPA: class I SAM-dependent methyltransferase [Mycobacteriales bacterium]|nr:class I SAM-dependent methyltransferase [Mycobacteriales bacterium]
MVSAEDFYDGLAADYDCLFPDWWEAARWHGTVIGRLLADEGVHPPAEVLDCTCGIGTQALPLVSMGYVVTGTDISAGAIERARAEAAARSLPVSLAVTDVRHVHEKVTRTFDAVISCDNALPHLLTDEDLDAGLRSIRSCLRPGGLFLATIRDYDELSKARTEGVPISLHGTVGERHASGQVWTWTPEGDRVDIMLFAMVESSEGWRTSTHGTTCRALRRAELTSALHRNGFSEVRWRTPEQSGYYQPTVTARACLG